MQRGRRVIGDSLRYGFSGGCESKEVHGSFLSGIFDPQKPGKRLSISAEEPDFCESVALAYGSEGRSRLVRARRTLLWIVTLLPAKSGKTSTHPLCESRNLSIIFGV